jgi:uncharacterized protein
MMSKIWSGMKFLGRWLGPALTLLALGFVLFPISPFGDAAKIPALTGAVVSVIALLAGIKSERVGSRRVLAVCFMLGLTYWGWSSWAEGRGYATETVSFDNQGAHLVGTLYLPERNASGHMGKVPGIVFLSGSGAAPRRYYSIFAVVFARAGYVTLLYDKRGVGDSTPKAVTRSIFDTDADNDYELLAEDAAAALSLLQKRPEVRADAVGVGGVSQGGIIAPRAAELNANAAFMLNLCAATTSLYEIIEFQTPKTDHSDSNIAKLKLRFTRNFDPKPSLRALNIPALWLMASEDTLVDNKATIRDLDALRKMGKPYEYRMIGGAWHGLFIGPKELVLETINAWLARMAETRH